MHGNEIVGKTIQTEIEKWAKTWNFNGKILLLEANPKAKRAKKRFIEQDLNRSFEQKENCNNYEQKRAQEIMNFFTTHKITPNYIFDFHSTPSKSEPMIICTNNNESLQLAQHFPIKFVVTNLIEGLKGTSIGKFFASLWTKDLAFECWNHTSQKTLQKWKEYANILRLFHQKKIIPKNKKQLLIKVTDFIDTEDPNFVFTKKLKAFDTLPAQTIRAKDGKKTHQFEKEKIIVLLNTNFADDLKKIPRTEVAYFWEIQ